MILPREPEVEEQDNQLLMTPECSSAPHSRRSYKPTTRLGWQISRFTDSIDDTQGVFREATKEKRSGNHLRRMLRA